MEINIHANVYVRPLEEGNQTNNKLDAILRNLDAIIRGQQESKNREVLMGNEVALLGTKVQKITDATTAIETVVKTMAATIIDLKEDPVALQAYAESLDASATKLAALALENTTAAPPA